MTVRLLLLGSLVFVSSFVAGCPKQPLTLPPPKVASGPAAQMLAVRDEAIKAVEADVTIRMRVPEGIEGAPGGKVRGHVLAAGSDEKARLDIWTPLGTLGAILLIADGQLQVYSPLENTLVKGPLDSKELAARSPLPIPMSALPALMRGEVVLEAGEHAETKEEGGLSLEVKRDERVVQRVLVDPDGGYPTRSVRFGEDGKPALTIDYLEYGGVETKAGPIAFPQKVKASIDRPEGVVSLEVSLANPKVNPDLAADAFELSFQTPPRVEEIP